jgi:hypothetical protein
MLGAISPNIVSHYRVSLAGNLAVADPAAANRCVLTLTAAPDPKPAGGGLPTPAEHRTYKAYIRWAGRYFFENVAPGTYQLAGRDGAKRQLERSVTLPFGESGERAKVVELDLQFTDVQPADQPPAEASTPRAQRGRGARGRR